MAKGKRTKLTKTAFRRLLKAHGGNVTGVAKDLECARQTIYNYLDRWDMHGEKDKYKTNLIRAAEDTIYDAVLAGDTDEARFVLTHHPKNPERWSSKHDVTVTGIPVSAETLRVLEERGLSVEDVAAQFERLVNAAAEVNDAR